LRIGDIALLLDNAKLALDQLKALVFPFKFTTQAFGKRPALGDRHQPHDGLGYGLNGVRVAGRARQSAS
jgi:hypothetical protein